MVKEWCAKTGLAAARARNKQDRNAWEVVIVEVAVYII
jgi:hypothetical protein